MIYIVIHVPFLLKMSVIVHKITLICLDLHNGIQLRFVA